MTLEAKPHLTVLAYHPEFATANYIVVCSKCKKVFKVYIWSIHGCGKKCPGCQTLYGPGDLVDPKVVKHKGKWVHQTAEGDLYDGFNRLIPADEEPGAK